MSISNNLMEKGYNIGESFKELVKNLSFPGLTTGLIGALFSSMGPGLIVMSAAKQGNLPDDIAVSWIFAIFFFAGLATMFVSLYYRVPLVIAYSIPGSVLIGKYLASGGNIHEAVGVYFSIAVLVIILTATGAIKAVIEHIPIPIMLGMVGGVLLSFGLNAFTSALTTPAVYGIMVIIYFIWYYFKGLSSKIPGVVVSLIVGVLLLKYFGLTKNVPIQWEVAKPVIVSPSFSLKGLLTLGVPLFFMVVGVQNIQAVGVLLSRGYKPPINAMYFIPSIATFFNGLFAGHTAVTAGPSTAICSSDIAGPKEYRWIASFFEGVFWVLVGLLAKVGVESAKLAPKEFMQVIAGLAMFEVFISVFEGAFSQKFRKGAMVAFFVAASGISLFNIGAPFWAIVFGVIASLIAENGDFKKINNEQQ
ncbi:benzoate/H(+) symporter BenE family transporter [Carboxydothermus hydrogenoformans]|uniref:Putative benzoate transporter n=1 Tax=Carboxydothermus hydrogenoformans (strain ATCC BAA-161 / DSM 6008 / Z-2901) TaxID=246194 RepID=Q3ACM9_CARHZ|nr:benzoate/H(+) symporter BenE family transporter [Carboxydothermus hydrogenoformans]ABB16236.1 putative benzoate transporter [Carboxydothermus hydrogenoformans Z-2901]